jgi:hypothetical protein
LRLKEFGVIRIVLKIEDAQSMGHINFASACFPAAAR